LWLIAKCRIIVFFYAAFSDCVGACWQPVVGLCVRRFWATVAAQTQIEKTQIAALPDRLQTGYFCAASGG
jgi:hypothetical protein